MTSDYKSLGYGRSKQIRILYLIRRPFVLVPVSHFHNGVNVVKIVLWLHDRDKLTFCIKFDKQCQITYHFIFHTCAPNRDVFQKFSYIQE